jgi:hypothetical protein
MPGLMEKALVLTAIPAFLVGLGIVRGFAHFYAQLPRQKELVPPGCP